MKTNKTMKNTIKILIGILIIFSVIANIQLYRAYKIEKNKLEKAYLKDYDSTKFVWNDVKESIPKDGSLVKIEFTKDSIIYLQPYLGGGTQYIIELTENIITVTDPIKDKVVYTELYDSKNKLSNALIKDNE